MSSPCTTTSTVGNPQNSMPATPQFILEHCRKFVFYVECWIWMRNGGGGQQQGKQSVMHGTAEYCAASLCHCHVDSIVLGCGTIPDNHSWQHRERFCVGFAFCWNTGGLLQLSFHETDCLSQLNCTTSHVNWLVLCMVWKANCSQCFIWYRNSPYGLQKPAHSHVNEKISQHTSCQSGSLLLNSYHDSPNHS